MSYSVTARPGNGLLLPAALLCCLLATLAVQTHALPVPRAGSGAMGIPPTVTIAGGTFAFRPGGDFTRLDVPVSPPLRDRQWQPALEIMRYEVSAADYQACVAAGACATPHPRHSGTGDVPAAGVSYNDATAYAAWLSDQTGTSWRLPTLEEWDFAADGLAVDHGTTPVASFTDPSQLWLATFDAQASEKAGTSPGLRPLGSFGTNRLGVSDMGGNVWEWTSTCHSRTRLDAGNAEISRIESCGVRLLEGRHRMPMSAFVEDARSGGCSMSSPPDNLGFRLVRDPSWLERLGGYLSSLVATGAGR